MSTLAEHHSVDEQWRHFEALVRERGTQVFDGAGPVIAARAPGRLDAMGGVADYSGGTVLELTLGEATFVAVQRRIDRRLRLRSSGVAVDGLAETVEVSLDSLIGHGLVVTYDRAHEALCSTRATAWAGYVVGCLYVLAASGWVDPDELSGLNVYVRGGVPLGAGVSSSAALEVATMTALCSLLDVQMDGLEVARLCQIVENRVVGAPCGIMDQVTSALGQERSLVVLKCQPHEVLGHQPLPKHWRIVGIDSRVKHSVGGRNYTRARVGAFMGLKVLQAVSGKDWGGYLCNLKPEDWATFARRVPETLTGREFSDRYGDLPDPVTRVDSDETYRVRACAEHPILENQRVREFVALMGLARDGDDDQITWEVGQLMLEAHHSYTERIELGSDETDLLVDLAMEQGREHGLFGAKITGGGSGGTVAVLCKRAESDAAISEVCRAYFARTGIEPGLVGGSSPGAMVSGARVLAI
jgi:galactokinase